MFGLAKLLGDPKLKLKLGVGVKPVVVLETVFCGTVPFLGVPRPAGDVLYCCGVDTFGIRLKLADGVMGA